jgi:hypothetical protein
MAFRNSVSFARNSPIDSLCVLCVSAPIIQFDFEKGAQYHSTQVKMPWYFLFINGKNINTEDTEDPQSSQRRIKPIKK